MFFKKAIVESGEYSLKTEIKALENILQNNINKDFTKLVEIILAIKGRVFLSGIGKPGYIAHRVSATLASTGTPAFYIHPSEASHGDLGMITKNDLVILLSNSGGSTELNDIIAYCKRNKIKLISLTRKAESFVAKSSDLSIVLENIEETNPVNSPTTSIIMMLAYLDAVATALIQARGFNNDNYKMFHPGGKLGSALIKVEEIMQINNLPIVYQNDSMETAIDEMIAKNLGCVGIVDNNTKKLVGIITDGDLKRKMKQFGDILKCKIVDIMTSNPVVIESDKLAVEAVSLMNKDDNYIQVLFVVDNNIPENELNVKGIIHIQDLFKAKVI